MACTQKRDPSHGRRAIVRIGKRMEGVGCRVELPVDHPAIDHLQADVPTPRFGDGRIVHRDFVLFACCRAITVAQQAFGQGESRFEAILLRHVGQCEQLPVGRGRSDGIEHAPFGIKAPSHGNCPQRLWHGRLIEQCCIRRDGIATTAGTPQCRRASPHGKEATRTFHRTVRRIRFLLPVQKRLGCRRPVFSVHRIGRSHVRCNDRLGQRGTTDGKCPALPSA